MKYAANDDSRTRRPMNEARSLRSLVSFWIALGGISLLGLACGTPRVTKAAEPLDPHAGRLELRLRRQHLDEATPRVWHRTTSRVVWDGRKTAIVVCDMWNQHWCRGATRRVAQMAPRMNEVLHAARRQGILVIHCPSSCLDAYEGSPQRQLARQAPPVETQVALQNWCHLDPQHEARLPIDDSDGGCDCQPQCPSGSPWTRQIETLEIVPGDAITDSGEAYYLMRQRGIENVLVMGVHTNMCVLGRPFSIRQLVYQGMNVALVRDLTDTMYNPRMPPFVNHFTGTDRVVDHIEKHWCPTLTSDQIAGGTPYRFPADRRPQVAVVMGEDEYHTDTTLPDFADRMLGDDFRVQTVFADGRDKHRFPGIDILDESDVLVLSVRRRTLPLKELETIKRFVAAGKPVVAIRTSSHAFSLRGEPLPDGAAEWTDFDAQVLGGNYHDHHGNKGPDDPPTLVWTESRHADHPILAGVRRDEFRVRSWLYKTSPLSPAATVLLLGRVGDRQPHEPVAWTHTTPAGGRVFYTSLGHPDDFKLPAFQQLLQNGIRWAAETPVANETVANGTDPNGN